MAELNQIDVATRRYIRKTPKLVDNIFQQGVVAAYAKENLREDYDGGRLIGENFWYQGLIGGAYLKGKEFDISEPQVEQELQFNPKFLEVNITLTKEDIQVINKGPNAAFKLIESRTQNAYITIGAHLEIGMYLNGQRAGYQAMFNGMAEALNDGSTASWDGSAYTTYGTITRGGAVGSSISSAPFDVNGPIQYTTLEEQYGAVTYGPDPFEPNLGVTTVLGVSLIKEKFQTQQRFNDTQTLVAGFNFRGLKFNGATIVMSRYCPGSYLFNNATAGGTPNGTKDPNAVTYITQSSNGTLTAYPVPSTYSAEGTWETLWFLNARKPFFNFYTSDDPEYGFGFTGFKPAQGNTKVAGQVLYSGAATWQPRYHKQLYRITG